MGGKKHSCVLGSTDSGVRLGGLSVHNGHAAVGPVRRSASDSSTAQLTYTRFASTVTDIVCTLDSCTHCCRCLLRHNRTGYGRCMRTVRRPWPYCECAGERPAGCCAQVECASGHVVADLTRSQSCLQHDDQRSSTVPDVSHPSTLSSPLIGMRRAAGGVHVDEDVCANPLCVATCTCLPYVVLTVVTDSQV